MEVEERIKSYSNELINSYVEQYGENYRDLITERFNNIVFCLYTSKDKFMYTQLKIQDLLQIYAVKLLNELGIYDVKRTNIIVSPRENEIKKLLDLIYSSNKHSNVIFYSMHSTFNEKSLSDFSREDIEFIEKITNKNINEVISIANKYIRAINELNIPKTIKEATDISTDYDKKMNDNFQQFILNGFDINEFVHQDRIKEMLCSSNVIASSFMELRKDGSYVPVVYFSPYSTAYRNIDTILDHEIRHTIEMYLDENKVLKTGLSYSCGHIESANKFDFVHRDIDEIMTQKMSLESTKKRYRKNIYIFTEKDYYLEGQRITGYDKYIPFFDKLVYGDLYRALVDAKINKTYSKELEKEIIRIENYQSQRELAKLKK